jgi:hypothetical protein
MNSARQYGHHRERQRQLDRRARHRAIPRHCPARAPGLRGRKDWCLVRYRTRQPYEREDQDHEDSATAVEQSDSFRSRTAGNGEPVNGAEHCGDEPAHDARSDVPVRRHSKRRHTAPQVEGVEQNCRDKSRSGRTINIGWIGWPKSSALLSIFGSDLAYAKERSEYPAVLRLSSKSIRRG